ncbi:GMC oxidoreductase-domain-containing protein [Melanogaster broomeanus]|nr:GMC oxidoreductase-domain-containing protein [Melanogaster broomeanus]
MNDAISCPEGSTEVTIVKASKLVVVSSGAFGSPAILERSGIGSPLTLNKHNVPVIVDLPGVGENYQDHFGVMPVFYASDETMTMDDVWSNAQEHAAWLKQWESSGKGKIATNGLEAMAKVRPTGSRIIIHGTCISVEMGRHSTSILLTNPWPSLHRLPASSDSWGDHSILPPQKFITVEYYILYPESTGRVHIGSGDDANVALDFDPGIISKYSADLPPLTMLYKRSRELARRMPCYRGEVPLYNPQFAADSPAACKETDGPVPISAPDIIYSAEDDEAIEDFLRNFVQSTWHSLGTCAMKPRAQGGVVDGRLNVYGVAGLKVADMSICPSNVGTNTYSTALLIGEKAAMIIAEDLGIEMSV